MPRQTKTPAAVETPRSLLSYPSTSVPFATLRMAPYNPRKVTDAQLDAICRSILTFGLVDPFVAREEDRLMIGGHQRARALGKLLEGRYVDPQTGKPVRFELPGGAVPVVLVPGLSDEGAKLLNLALNKVGGEWDDDKLEQLLKELAAGAADVDSLVVSGFTSKEIDAIVNAKEEGTGPLPAARSPKLSLDFSSKEIRDAVKAKIASRTGKEELSGDALARLLRVHPEVKPAPPPAAPVEPRS